MPHDRPIANLARLETLAGLALILGGLMMVVPSLVSSAGEAQGWGAVDAFAAASTRPLYRVGMLLGALGLAVVVAATPLLVARAAGTAGFAWTAANRRRV